MKLNDAIAKILTGNDTYDVVFAKKPWHFNSEAVISKFEENYSVPLCLHENGFEYFLEYPLIAELSLVKEERKLTEEEFVRFVIFYAENDAYMDID